MELNYFEILTKTPWKAINEVLMLIIKPFVFLYLILNGVQIGRGFKFYGFPKIFRTNGSRIIIGDRFESRSWWWSNPLGVNHPTIITTWSKNASIIIGSDVGVSGASIAAEKSIKIGDRVLVGANSTIIDTDFHPLKGNKKRYSTKGVRVGEVKIGNDVFIGMNSIVLKGVNINNNSVIPAGSVVR